MQTLVWKIGVSNMQSDMSVLPFWIAKCKGCRDHTCQCHTTVFTTFAPVTMPPQQLWPDIADESNLLALAPLAVRTYETVATLEDKYLRVSQDHKWSARNLVAMEGIGCLPTP